MKKVKLAISNICSALESQTVGTKILDKEGFFKAAEHAIALTNFDAQREPGQAYIPCPDAVPFISAGVGKRTENPNDYTCRLYRGNMSLFLKRKKAAPVDGCALIVYTKEQKIRGAQLEKDFEEAARIRALDCTHVIVAVLGFAGPKAPLSPYRLVHNLAGGNHEALQWSADEIREKAKESKDYWDKWCTVADEIPQKKAGGVSFPFACH